jgi:hypothetical protein
MIDSYPFGQVFQMKLLALLLQQPQKVSGFIEPQYFQIGHYVEVARIALEIYAKYLPEKPDFRLDYDSLKEAVLAGKEDSERKDYKRLLKSALGMKLDDHPFLIDQAKRFAQESRYREALIASAKDVNAHHYDRLHQRFDELRPSMRDHCLPRSAVRTFKRLIGCKPPRTTRG